MIKTTTIKATKTKTTIVNTLANSPAKTNFLFF